MSAFATGRSPMRSGQALEQAVERTEQPTACRAHQRERHEPQKLGRSTWMSVKRGQRQPAAEQRAQSEESRQRTSDGAQVQ